MKGKKFLAGLLSAILAFNSNVGVLAVGGEEDVRDSGPSHTVTITASNDTPAAGESVTLTASDVEDADSLQWQKQANQDAGWTNLENETGNTYTFTWPEEQEQATYRLEATWGEEKITSNELKLTKRSDVGEGKDLDVGDNKDPDGGEPADVPKTGDETGLFLWLALFVVSGAGLAAVGFRRVVIRRRMRRRVPPQK